MISSLLILLFSESHYYVSHVILFSWECLGQVGRYTHSVLTWLLITGAQWYLSLSDTGLWGVENQVLFPYPSLVAWGRWEGDHATMPDLRVINNHQFSPCALLTFGAHCFSLTWLNILFIPSINWIFALSLEQHARDIWLLHILHKYLHVCKGEVQTFET